MPSHKLPNYLRTHRKRSGLSQREIAFLLGCEAPAKVSRHEHFARVPGLSTVFAYAVIFKVPAEELFAGIYQQVQERTFAQARLLERHLRAAKPHRQLQGRFSFVQGIWRPLNDVQEELADFIS